MEKYFSSFKAIFITAYAEKLKKRYNFEPELFFITPNGFLVAKLDSTNTKDLVTQDDFRDIIKRNINYIENDQGALCNKTNVLDLYAVKYFSKIPHDSDADPDVTIPTLKLFADQIIGVSAFDEGTETLDLSDFKIF